MQGVGLIKVADYWQLQIVTTTWQKWLAKDQWPTQNHNGNIEQLLQQLEQHRILTSTREDILRWGNNPKGTFNLKEAYKISAASPDWQPDLRWHALWTRGNWSKITLFSWLIMHNRALTWNNLQRRGFIEPSRCALCENEIETLNHILNTCPIACALWDDMAFIFRPTDKNRDSIGLTLSNWRITMSNNNLINRAWNLIPGAVVWILWKERNARIFKNSVTTMDRLMEKSRQLITETIHAMDITQQ